MSGPLSQPSNAIRFTLWLATRAEIPHCTLGAPPTYALGFPPFRIAMKLILASTRYASTTFTRAIVRGVTSALLCHYFGVVQRSAAVKLLKIVQECNCDSIRLSYADSLNFEVKPVETLLHSQLSCTTILSHCSSRLRYSSPAVECLVLSTKSVVEYASRRVHQGTPGCTPRTIFKSEARCHACGP
jgi:hypothetical protein